MCRKDVFCILSHNMITVDQGLVTISQKVYEIASPICDEVICYVERHHYDSFTVERLWNSVKTTLRRVCLTWSSWFIGFVCVFVVLKNLLFKFSNFVFMMLDFIQICVQINRLVILMFWFIMRVDGVNFWLDFVHQLSDWRLGLISKL